MINNEFYKPYGNNKECISTIIYYKTLRNKIFGIKVCFNDFKNLMLNCIIGLQQDVGKNGLFDTYLQNYDITYTKLCRIKNKALSINELKNSNAHNLDSSLLDRLIILEGIKYKLLLLFNEARNRNFDICVLFCDRDFSKQIMYIKELHIYEKNKAYEKYNNIFNSI